MIAVEWVDFSTKEDTRTKVLQCLNQTAERFTSPIPFHAYAQSFNSMWRELFWEWVSGVPGLRFHTWNF